MRARPNVAVVRARREPACLFNQAACCGGPYTSTLGIEFMADPSQSFRDFERAGWEDARVVELYEQHLSRITTQSIGALLDTAGVRSGMSE